MSGIINHLKRLDWILLGAIALVFLMGLLTFYGSSAGRDLFLRQLVFGLISLTIIISLSFFDWRVLKENAILILILYAAGLAALFVLFAVGSKIRGVTSWFKLGGINFEPVELVKIILVAVLAKYFSARHIELYRWKNIFISGLYVLIPTVLVMMQPDLGSAIILISIWFGMILIAGIKAKQFLWLLVLVFISAGVLWGYGLKDYQKNRVTSFLYPQRDLLGGAYQSAQAIIAIGSGGLWGKGIGQGTQARLGFLPEYQTDFIFATIAEEWGMVGVFIFLLAWFFIFFRLYKILLLASDNFSRLFLSGFIIVIGMHFLVNIGANLGFLPITGLPLAFVSYGGSNLISLSVGLGIVQAIKAKVFRQSFNYDEASWVD